MPYADFFFVVNIFLFLFWFFFPRIVLIVDVWHPKLTDEERAAIRHLDAVGNSNSRGATEDDSSGEEH